MLFFIFRGQTSSQAFLSDLAYGGATYHATGRGYKLRVGLPAPPFCLVGLIMRVTTEPPHCRPLPVVQATPFIEVFMRYSRR
jgi:hypothetical protein